MLPSAWCLSITGAVSAAGIVSRDTRSSCTNESGRIICLCKGALTQVSEFWISDQQTAFDVQKIYTVCQQLFVRLTLLGVIVCLRSIRALLRRRRGTQGYKFGPSTSPTTFLPTNSPSTFDNRNRTTFVSNYLYSNFIHQLSTTMSGKTAKTWQEELVGELTFPTFKKSTRIWLTSLLQPNAAVAAGQNRHSTSSVIVEVGH